MSTATVTDQLPAEGLAITYRRVTELKPYIRNPRDYSDEQIGQVVASIEEFGWTAPILVDGEDGVIAGHRRLLAAERMGMDFVPTIELAGLSEEQRRAYVIADNQLTINGGWDDKLLAEEVQALAAGGFDTSLLGFSDDETAILMAPFGTEEDETEDEAPEPPETPVSRPGDLWLLGPHRVLCGDATDADCVRRLLDGTEPHLMVTDPPYGVEYDATWRDRTNITRSKQVSTGLVANDDRADWSEAYALFPGDVAYVWHPGGAIQLVFGQSLRDAGFEIRTTIVWAKQGFVIGRGHYHVQHEPCFYAVRKGRTGHWQGSRKESTIWEINNANLMQGGSRDDMQSSHGTQKPVECMRRPMVNNSKAGDLVYDPFLGSGTSVIAAETTRRICLGLELDPAYVDVIVTRYQDFTEKVATLDGDGRTFGEILVERTAVEGQKIG